MDELEDVLRNTYKEQHSTNHGYPTAKHTVIGRDPGGKEQPAHS